jgi:hypothetical protein
MTLIGIAGLFALAMLAAGAAIAVYALALRALWHAYVAMWLFMTFGLFVFALLVASGLVVKP